MTPLDCINKIITSGAVKLDFMCRGDAVNYRNTVANTLLRKKKDYVAFGLLEDGDANSLLSTIEEDTSKGWDGAVLMTLTIGKRKRKYGGPTSFTIVEE